MSIERISIIDIPTPPVGINDWDELYRHLDDISKIASDNFREISDKINFSSNTVKTFIDGDTTPSVEDEAEIYRTANTGSTTVTFFDGGYIGQSFKLLFDDSYTTIDFTGTNLIGNGGSDWSPAAGDWLEAVFDGTKWRCSCHDCTS